VSSTVEQMRKKLAALSPKTLDITDDSASHAGHAGAKSGGGHFFLTIVSDTFVGKTTMARHRMVYDALGDMMQREIHALSIKAYTAAEL
jgi:BolA family transcriptional regulator, general stress-responsive regulator